MTRPADPAMPAMPAMPALLMVAMEPPAPLEEEFHDWYDTEHLPQRRSLPGFASASRWCCIDGWPRWMALYELDARAALGNDAYLEVSGANSTPWSRRLLPRTVGRSRVVAEALERGEAVVDDRRISRLLVAAATPGAAAVAEVDSAVRRSLAGRDDLLFARGFLESEPGAEPRLWWVAAFDAPVQAGALAVVVGRPAGCPIATFDLYVPYRRSSY